jgi:16S rRNA (adenine1518-N6/adenine1519-N6)-dimethyltransferase
VRRIVAAAGLEPSDTVLEIGPGLGSLTLALADAVAAVVAIELDAGFVPVLREVLADHRHVRVVHADALQVDLTELLEGHPARLVANLPYNVATPILMESLDGLPGVELWCVMVQREVADRLFAAPATKAYGAVSVLIQLVTRRTGFHGVSRSVFRPPPNVDSALVAFRRVGLPAGYRDVKRVVEGAFAHRRKTLSNSLELAGVAPRERGVAALAAVGRAPETRAEELAPGEFVALAEALGC